MAEYNSSYLVSLIALFVCYTLAGSTSNGVKAELADDHVTLESFCNNKPVRLVSISQVRRLIADSRSAEIAACNDIRRSLDQLDDILEVVESGRSCNLDLVEKIRRFNYGFVAQAYIDKKTSDNQVKQGDSRLIPDVVRQFFISLCFQISAECKITMINSLEYDTQDLISESDYATIKLLEHNGVTMLSAETEVSDFDDIILLDDLKNSLVDGKQMAPSKLLLKVRTSEVINDLIRTCRNKFKPIYDKLIMPLIKLSNLGFNYQGELLERELEELRHNELVKRWYNIVQTCEAFDTVEIYEDPDMCLSDDRRAISFVSITEAQKLAKQQASPSELDESPIEYEQVITHNSDRLWIQDQQELERLVWKYRAHTSETDRIRTRLFRKMLAQLKEAYKSGHIFSLAKQTIKNIMPGNSAAESIKTNQAIAAEDFIQMIDEAVESNESSVVMNEIDSAVAGTTYRRTKQTKKNYVPPRVNYVPGHKLIYDSTKVGEEHWAAKVKDKTRGTVTGLKNYGKDPPKPVEGTRVSYTLWDREVGAVMPSKWHVMFWLMVVAIVLIIIVHVSILGR